MASSFGGTIKLQGESEYKKALKDITTNLKLMSSELKLTNTEFSNGDKSVKQTKASYDSMNKTVQEQKTKVDELRVTLKEMEKQYGSNDEKVKTFKMQLNNAENQLKQMEEATDKSNKELKEMKEGFDEAGNGAVKFGDLLKANVLGDAITGGLKALGSAVKTIGSAFIDIGKQAVDSYADFQQLEGGVKKLFNDDMSTVMNNANNAFASAGMSANEYMQTVTSFSASLISSLDDDTAAAAKIADMAIKDMSDNANTFGTDMSLIQNAYQGFAKGQYNMLDNLKLGYGGTKTEMERLLADAEKMPEAMGQKFDISNYSDVVKAINIVQQNMKITGTTQTEASKTITGSISSMQSAWQNLLTGLANGEADLTSLIDNVVGSALTVVDNVMPAIEQVVNSIIESLPTLLNKIIEYLPQFLTTGSNILTTLINGLQSNMSIIMTAVLQIINMLINTLVQNLPQILQMGITILVELVKGIAESLPTLIPAVLDALLLMVETLINNIDLIIDAGIQLILGLADGLIEGLPILIDKIPIIIEKLIMAITNNLPKIIEMGITLIVQLAVGLVKAIPQLVSKIPQILTAICKGLSNGLSSVIDIGKNLVQGLWNGINNAKDWVLDKIKGFGKSVLNGLKSFFGINSPSTLMRDQVGTYLAQGIGVGFENEMINVNKDIQNALPSNFDLSANLTLDNSISKNNASLNAQSGLINEFKQALSQMHVVLDDEKVGSFVENKVTRLIYN